MNPIDFFIEQIVINSYCKVRKLVCSDVCFDMMDGSPRGLTMNVTEYAQKTKKMIENKFFIIFPKLKKKIFLKIVLPHRTFKLPFETYFLQ